MIGDCPSCLTRVLMTVGEPCPSCGQIVTQDLLEAFKGLAAVTVDEGSPVPPHCFLCDAPSTLLLKIHVNPKDGRHRVENAESRREELTLAARTIFTFLKAYLAAVLFHGFHTQASFDKDTGVRVYIPSCTKCQSRVHVARTSGYNRSVTILAGANYPQRIQEARKVRSQT